MSETWGYETGDRPNRGLDTRLISVGVVLCLATCVLALLQAGGDIDWGWAWVLAPMWSPVLALFLLGAVAVTEDNLEAARRGRRRR